MRRHERVSTLFTSNRPVEDWDKLLGDAAAVSAMLDRLLHHGHVLKCGAPGSRRPVSAVPDAGHAPQGLRGSGCAEHPQTEVASAAKLAHGTILIVEDETSLLSLATTVLERLGLTVLAASTPTEAIRLAEAHEKQLLLLITDVVMPEMNGRDLAKQLEALCPGLKCLFMSGYTNDGLSGSEPRRRVERAQGRERRALTAGGDYSGRARGFRRSGTSG
jgi:CheY-like chemotaxis protein